MTLMSLTNSRVKNQERVCSQTQVPNNNKTTSSKRLRKEKRKLLQVRRSLLRLSKKCKNNKWEMTLMSLTNSRVKTKQIVFFQTSARSNFLSIKNLYILIQFNFNQHSLNKFLMFPNVPRFKLNSPKLINYSNLFLHLELLILIYEIVRVT